MERAPATLETPTMAINLWILASSPDRRAVFNPWRYGVCEADTKLVAWRRSGEIGSSGGGCLRRWKRGARWLFPSHLFAVFCHILPPPRRWPSSRRAWHAPHTMGIRRSDSSPGSADCVKGAQRRRKAHTLDAVEHSGTIAAWRTACAMRGWPSRSRRAMGGK